MKLREVVAHCRRLFVRRKYKDILFRFVFQEKEALLQLYNAVNHTNYTNQDDLVITTMEDVIYIGMKNDLSFLIANELNLYEHQSTVNRNMPLRGLLYLARMYESYIDSNKLNRYQKQLIPLPFPRFIVFYNGEEEVEEEFIVRLSEAFGDQKEEPAVECVARFININYGHNKELMNSCRRLHDYSFFIACVRKYLKKGFERKEAVVQATDECISKGILEDILRKHRGEVMEMFLTTFDKKMYEEALRAEGREEAAQKYEQLSRDHEELSKDHEELSKDHEELSKDHEELTKAYEKISGNFARFLLRSGVSYEEAKELMGQLREEDLKDIYGRK